MADLRSMLKDIIVFGAGTRGRRSLAHMSALGLAVRAFCDNDPAKQGTLVDGVPVMSFGELLRLKDEVVVLVSPKESEDIYRDLAEHGVRGLDPQELRGFAMEPGKFPPPGEYYSPYPDKDYVKRNAKRIYDEHKPLLGIDLNLGRQTELLGNFEELYPTVPQWPWLNDGEADSRYRYRLGNGWFDEMDAVTLHCMLRHLRPRRLVEVGSGWSSAVTLDTNEFFLGNSVALSFVEPYPERLRSILKPSDDIELHECKLQDMPLSFFDRLQANDVLFIDSSHASKVGSDVNYYMFEILPRLARGVCVHLHDIVWPMEMPLDWVQNGRGWNETYLLRAFLMGNRGYEVQFFTHMLTSLHRERLAQKWPFGRKNLYGGSFWMRKA